MGATIGVIGGTGLYEMEELEVVGEQRLETPFGEPSDAFVLGRIGGIDVAFLPRHGRGHRLLPTEVNYRANIYGMKQLGVEHLISVSAVGSMKEEYRPRDVVLPDQFFDRTRLRNSTFFGRGLVAHVSIADPVCATLSEAAAVALASVEARHHCGGTYLCMEGPQFSTRAESRIYRQWNVDVIGMTNLQEAKLSREAEMCYVCLAFVTDYDCWKEDEEDVSSEGVMAVLSENVRTARSALAALVPGLGSSGTGTCACKRALDGAVLSDLGAVPSRTLDELEPLIARLRRDSR